MSSSIFFSLLKWMTDYLCTQEKKRECGSDLQFLLTNIIYNSNHVTLLFVSKYILCIHNSIYVGNSALHFLLWSNNNNVRARGALYACFNVTAKKEACISLDSRTNSKDFFYLASSALLARCCCRFVASAGIRMYTNR